MAIIKQPTPPPVPTKEQLKAQTKIQITAATNNMFKQIILAFQKNLEAVWENQDGLTPQEVFDAFGTDAAELFKIAGATQDFMNGIMPKTLVGAAPYEYKLNPDGTVTIGNKIKGVRDGRKRKERSFY